MRKIYWVAGVFAYLTASFCVTASDSGTAEQQLGAVIDAYWQSELSMNTERVRDEKTGAVLESLPDVSAAHQARVYEESLKQLAALKAIKRAHLSEEDALNYDVLMFALSNKVALGKFRGYRIPINSDSGFYFDVMQGMSSMKLTSVAEYEAYLKRLKSIPVYFAENTDNMKTGMKEGFVLPKAVMPGLEAVIMNVDMSSAEKSPFYDPFRMMPKSIKEADQRRLKAAAKKAIEGDVFPAYRAFQVFFKEDYLPKASESIAASDLPEGAAYYDALVKFFTNLDMTADDAHKRGLQEVARIQKEMKAVIKKTGFKGDFASFLAFLRTDPQFYPKTGEDLLKDASYIAKEIDGELPDYFGKLPRMPYGVAPVPAAIAPNYTAGRYVPSPDGKRAGFYWVNTYALESRPLYNLTALTLHEAVPGHHLQGSLAQELKGVPAFRNSLYPHAFGEGWALYAEKLGVEMGIYKTPYDDFGRLTYEMWRACRLVIDTGMHAKGWSRQQAIDYLASHTALSLHEVRTEIDRYISWPGQALAYKMGELKIWELRHKAEQALGDRFDIRAFHDAVNAHGALPLPALEQQINEYIAKALTQSNG